MHKFESKSNSPSLVMVLLLVILPSLVSCMSLDANHHVQCLDGSEATSNNSANCAENNCPSSGQDYMCPNGFCTTNLEACAMTSNCPLDRPFICPNLLCVSDPVHCSNYPAFKFRPPFVNLSASSNLTLTYEDETMEVGVAWDASEVSDPDFVVSVGPISDDEVIRCTLLTDNTDQAQAIRLAAQPAAYNDSFDLNPLMTMMSPIVNVSTLSGAGFPTGITVSLQVNPYFDYSSYILATVGIDQALIFSDSGTTLTHGSTSTGKPSLSFTTTKSAIYVMLYYPTIAAEGYYSYMDCGWACEYPKEFMMVFFSAIYISLVISMTFWCVAVQTEQRKIDRRKEIKKQKKLIEYIKSEQNEDEEPRPPKSPHDQDREPKPQQQEQSQLQSQSQNKPSPETVDPLRTEEIKLHEEKKASPIISPANYSFAASPTESPQAKREIPPAPDLLAAPEDKKQPAVPKPVIVMAELPHPPPAPEAKNPDHVGEAAETGAGIPMLETVSIPATSPQPRAQIEPVLPLSLADFLRNAQVQPQAADAESPSLPADVAPAPEEKKDSAVDQPHDDPGVKMEEAKIPPAEKVERAVEVTNANPAVPAVSVPAADPSGRKKTDPLSEQTDAIPASSDREKGAPPEKKQEGTARNTADEAEIGDTARSGEENGLAAQVVMASALISQAKMPEPK